MPKDRLKVIFGLRRAIIRGQLVAHGTRSDVALGRMATVAITVSCDADRDRLARARGRVAMSTSVRRPAFSGLVGGVVKFHIKALDELDRKSVH